MEKVIVQKVANGYLVYRLGDEGMDNKAIFIATSVYGCGILLEKLLESKENEEGPKCADL